MAANKLQRQPCTVYSRVVGYLSPIEQWNKGKRAEYNNRQEYNKQISKSF